MFISAVNLVFLTWDSKGTNSLLEPAFNFTSEINIFAVRFVDCSYFRLHVFAPCVVWKGSASLLPVLFWSLLSDWIHLFLIYLLVLMFLFSPVYTATSLGSLLSAPYRRQYHLQTSWSTETPAWPNLSAARSLLENKVREDPSCNTTLPWTHLWLVPHTSPLSYYLHTSPTPASQTFLPFLTFSCSTI